MADRKIEYIDFKMTLDRWHDKNAKVNAISSPYWGNQGARSGLMTLPFKIGVEGIGFHYTVINAGIIDGRGIKELIKKETEHITGKDSKERKENIKRDILDLKAFELANIIPRVEKPVVKKDESPFVGIYLIPSLMIDGLIGQEILFILQTLRTDIHIFRMGADYTYLKGIGTDADERKVGQLIGWLNPVNASFRSKYASTAVDNAVSAAEKNPRNKLPAFWMVGGFGANLMEPVGGLRKREVIAQPILHIPTPREIGAPSLDMNQIGFQVIEVDHNGKDRLVHSYPLGDITKNEMQLIKAEENSTKIQKNIIELIKDVDGGLSVGSLVQPLGQSRDVIQNAIELLVFDKNTPKTFPGLVFDSRSRRYAIRNEWLKNDLLYTYDFPKEKIKTLTRLIFGCAHIGYTTTDYPFIRQKFVELIMKYNVDVIELVGDALAGLKHDLIHQGEIISNLNYTEQGIFAGELFGTVEVEVFKRKFRMPLSYEGDFNKKLLEAIDSALVEWIAINGNHDEWEITSGHIPGIVLITVMRQVVFEAILRYLEAQGVNTINAMGLLDIIHKKIVLLVPDEKLATIYKHNDISIELMHPRMGRAATKSLRLEHALGSSEANFVSIANFHTGIAMESWDQVLGQRIAIQAGTLTIGTKFEKGIMKIVEFGVAIVKSNSYNGRVINTSKAFYGQPTIIRPYRKTIDPEDLKRSLNILRYRI